MTDNRSPRLAWPFSVLPEEDRVWLIAGEDVRFCLEVGAHASWVAEFVTRLDGTQTQTERLEALEPSLRPDAKDLLDSLYGERLVVDGPADLRHRPCTDVEVFRQDSLDYAALLRENRKQLDAGRRWVWVTSGPMARGYVSPLFLPDAGPCATSLLTHFKKLSPEPEIYDLLLASEHAPASSPMPKAAADLLDAILRCKLDAASEPRAAPALYQLHVVEADEFTVTAHDVLADPECPECNRYRTQRSR